MTCKKCAMDLSTFVAPGNHVTLSLDTVRLRLLKKATGSSMDAWLSSAISHLFASGCALILCLLSDYVLPVRGAACCCSSGLAHWL